MAKKYCGKLVYIGKGRIGTVTNYEYHETGNAVNESWTCRLLRSKSTVMVTEKPLIIESVGFAVIKNALTCAVRIKGQTYCGYAIKAPEDINDGGFAKRLAVARAIGDTDGIAELLDEDFNATYEEEYHDGNDDDNYDKADED